MKGKMTVQRFMQRTDESEEIYVGRLEDRISERNTDQEAQVLEMWVSRLQEGDGERGLERVQREAKDSVSRLESICFQHRIRIQVPTLCRYQLINTQ